MEPAKETTPAARMNDATHAHQRASASRAKSNTYRFREQWLSAAVDLLAPMFVKAGAAVPDSGRVAIGFTSQGGKGNCVGQCWHNTASADGHFEIFIRPDKSEPVEVLGILAHELVHSALPIGSGHGKVYKELALKIGLEGKMRHAMPGMHLTELLKEMASELGPFPHASLDLSWRESAPRKKQKTAMLKAFCEGVKDESDKVTEPCDYVCRITAIHAQKGAPICGVHQLRMTVEWPEEPENEGQEGEEGEPERSFKASLPPGGEVDPGSTPHISEPGSSAKFKPLDHVKTPEDAIQVAEAVAGSSSHDPQSSTLGFRSAVPGEVLLPGHTIRLNLTTGENEISEARHE